MSSVAIVTGANKGIGLATVKSLAKVYNGTIFLTARNEERGKAAMKTLSENYSNVKFHSLDINDPSSIAKFANHLTQHYSGIDILVNNAAIAYKFEASEPFSVQANETVKVNYFGVKETCKQLFPLLNPGARVVNVSSSAGHLARIPGESLRKRFANDKLTIEDLDELMCEYLKSVENGTFESKGWPLRSYLTKAGLSSTYSASKVGLSALSRLQQNVFDAEHKELDISVNFCHPGFVDTDMSHHRGHLTPEEGSRPIIYAATLPKNTTIKGQFIWHDCSVKNWCSNDCPK